MDVLRIENVALIDKLEINFKDGLNILSGETGAGKSIIIDAIYFLMGQKANLEFIRTNERSAIVEGLFYLKNPSMIKEIIDMGIEIEEDELLLLHRIVNDNGRSRCRANGKHITIGMLQKLGKMLIDIHGQHDQSSLLNKEKHINLLDQFCIAEISPIKNELVGIYREYKDVIKDINLLIEDERQSRDKIDLYTFQIDEISSAKITTNEEKTLQERKKSLLSADKLISSAKEALILLDSGDSFELSAIDKISKAFSFIQNIAELDENKKYLSSILINIETELQEVVREVKDYCENFFYDKEELENIEQRLNLFYQLKRKYGSSIEEILEYLQMIQKKLDLISNKEEELQKLTELKDELYTKGINYSEKISTIRKKQAFILQKEVEEVLHDLGMQNAKFEIEFIKKDEFSTNGYDNVVFLISPNIGEPLKELDKIASGGEMSRIMLALKTILAKVDTIDTFVFDEIDTGVSGRAAQKVAEKLSIVSKTHQILCITHLPQIAAMADSHFLIEKNNIENKTFTNIKILEQKETIDEIARLIGGVQITNQTIKAATELKELASLNKKTL